MLVIVIVIVIFFDKVLFDIVSFIEVVEFELIFGVMIVIVGLFLLFSVKEGLFICF